MADEEAPFLSRWARRKQAVREEETREQQTPTQEASLGTQAVEESEDPNRPLTPEEVAELPDPDTLEPGSDFKAFLREGVPEELKRRALRRLWRSNPVFGLLDGLNDYDLDYTDAATVVANLQTVFKVGKGAVLPEEQEEAGEKSGETEGETASPATRQAPEETSGERSAETSERTESTELRDAPATDEPESGDRNKVTEVEKPPISTRLPDLSALDPKSGSPAAEAVEQPQRREKGRAAQRRWGAFS